MASKTEREAERATDRTTETLEGLPDTLPGQPVSPDVANPVNKSPATDPEGGPVQGGSGTLDEEVRRA